MLKQSLGVVAASILLACAGLAQAAAIGPVAAVHVTASPDMAKDAKVIGPRDIDELTTSLKKTLESRFKAKQMVSDKGGVLDVVILKATPSRPTFTQLVNNVSLSMESYGLGGMEVAGTYTAADGKVTPVKFHYEAPDIRDAPFGWTWQAAEDGFNHFAMSLTQG